MDNNNALIIFTRLPIGSETKTRLAPVLTEAERADLHIAMWNNIFKSVIDFNAINACDVYLYWTGSGNVSDYAHYIPPQFILREQCQGSLGDRMRDAMSEVFASGRYAKVCLIGCDIPGLKAVNLVHAFDMLDYNDAVIAPTFDGGYWLIGMSKFINKAFDAPPCDWGNADVFNWTLAHIKSLGLSCACLDADRLLDIDTPEDLERLTGIYIKDGTFKV